MTIRRHLLLALIATLGLSGMQPLAAASSAGTAEPITPADVRALKQRAGAGVVFIDVRSRVEAALRGTAAGVDFVVPFREVAYPLRWDSARASLAMVANPAFVSQVQSAVRAQGATAASPLVLLCASGVRAGQAADVLRKAGFDRVLVVVGGLDGSVAHPGWRASGLPTVASADEDQLFGVPE